MIVRIMIHSFICINLVLFAMLRVHKSVIIVCLFLKIKFKFINLFLDSKNNNIPNMQNLFLLLRIKEK